jgi:hypothetical protein
MARTSRVEIPITAQDKATRTIKRVERNLKGFAATTRTVLGGLTGFGSVAGAAGFTMLAKRSIDLGSRLDDVSKKLGVTTDFLQEFGFAAREVGVNTESAEMGLQRFTRRVAEAQNGTGELLPVLNQYNIALKESDGTTRSAEAVLMDYANAVKAAQSPQERLRMAFKAFDSEGAALVSILSNGERGLRDYADRARELGQVLDQDTISQLALAENELERFATSATIQMGKLVGGLRKLRNEMTGAFNEDSFDLVRNFSNALKSAESVKELEAVESQIKETASTLLSVTDSLKKARDEGNVFSMIDSAEMDKVRKLFPDIAYESEKYQLNVIKPIIERLEELLQTADRVRGTLPNMLPEMPVIAEPPADLGQMSRTAEMQKLLGQTYQYAKSLKELSSAYMDRAEAVKAVNGVTDEYIRLLRLAKGAEEELESTLEELKDNATQNFTMMTQASQIFATGLENGLVNAAQNGKTAFGDMAQFILAELQRMLIRAMLFQAFTGLGFTGFAANFAPPPVAGTAAGGGPVKGGRSYIVGERGPEIVTMGGNGFVTPNHQLGGPTFNVDMRGASLEAVQRLEQFVMQVNGSIEQRSVAAVQDRYSRAPSYMRR